MSLFLLPKMFNESIKRIYYFSLKKKCVRKETIKETVESKLVYYKFLEFETPYFVFANLLEILFCSLYWHKI